MTIPLINCEAPANSPTRAHWYAVYANSRHEKVVARQLEQRGIETFLPLYRTWHRWKDRRRQVELALFPSYVFVKIGAQEKLRVLQVSGVVHFVSFNGQLAALPAEDIEGLRARLSGQFKIEPHPYIHTGRRVRVRSGPMEGMEGIVVRRKNRCRVIFSIDLIKRSLAIEVDEADLEVA